MRITPAPRLLPQGKTAFTMPNFNSFKQAPKDVFATSFPGAAEVAETFKYFQAHTYLGSNSYDQIALANKIAGGQATKFATWARVNFPVQVGQH